MLLNVNRKFNFGRRWTLQPGTDMPYGNHQIVKAEGAAWRYCQKDDHLRQFNLSKLDDLQVTVLIGQDNINLISPVKVEQWPSSAPRASHLKHSWAISGPHTALDDSKSHNSMHHTALFSSNCLDQDKDLNEEISHCWKAETIPLDTKSKPDGLEVLLANNIHNTTCVRPEDGRYETDFSGKTTAVCQTTGHKTHLWLILTIL